MSKHLDRVKCWKCGQQLTRTVCGNIVDYLHPIKCREYAK